MVYEFHHVVGPADGQTAFAFRLDFRMRHPDHAIYQCETEGAQLAMEWVDNDTRVITPHFLGFWPEVPDA